MPYRSVPIVTGEIYHIFNRGVEERDIFLSEKDYQRFLDTMVYYQIGDVSPRFSLRSNKLKTSAQNSVETKLVEVICYCLMPNHFHLLLKQFSEDGIANFIGRVANSYARYFNTKNKRTGHLFQSPYKAVRIESDEQLVHVSRYIHLNPLVSGIIKDTPSHKWSSYRSYLEEEVEGFCAAKEVLDYFPKPRGINYQKFVLDQVDNARKLGLIKYLAID